MIFNNRRVEEDLERILETNRSVEMTRADETKLVQSSWEAEITAKDILAMSIAVLGLILPYVIIISAGIGLVMFWFFR